MNKQHPLAEQILNRTRAVPLAEPCSFEDKVLLNTDSPVEASPLPAAAALVTPCGTCEDLGLAFLAAAGS